MNLTDRLGVQHDLVFRIHHRQRIVALEVAAPGFQCGTLIVGDIRFHLPPAGADAGWMGVQESLDAVDLRPVAISCP